MMINRNNNLDEMQEQKLLKIEHNSAWFAFWGLLGAIIVQIIIGGENTLQNIAGEWIVFMCLAVYLAFSCLKHGIWDRKLSPNPKTNIIVSLIAGILFGIFLAVSSYIRYQILLGSIVTFAIGFFTVFVSTLILLSVFAYIYKRRVNKLESKLDE